MAVWLVGLLAYSYLSWDQSTLDRGSGALGKFYLFRPSSLIELLWLMVALAFAIRTRGELCGTAGVRHLWQPSGPRSFTSKSRAFGARDRRKQRHQDAESPPRLGCDPADSTR